MVLKGHSVLDFLRPCTENIGGE